MSTLAERSIAALRAAHDELAALVPRLSEDQLSGPSGAAEWSVAQVLSHLGSGAEIALGTYRTALADPPGPPAEPNEAVWARWNALAPAQQAAGFVESDERLVRTLEGLSAQQREGTSVDLSFLPAPLPLASALGMRLHEVAQHSWDVRVALDPDAEIGTDAAEVLVEHFTGGLGFLLGFMGRAEELRPPAVIALTDDLRLVVDEGLRLSRSSGEPTARFSGDLGAVVRLIGGRLKAPWVPPDLEVSGDRTLADLQRAFPGF